MPRSRERFTAVRFYTLIVLTGYLTYTVIQPFLVPLAWAAIFALMLAPLQARGAARMGPARAAGLVTAGAALVAVVPAALLAVVLASEIPRALSALAALKLPTPERLMALWEALRLQSPVALPEDPGALLTDAAQRMLATLAPRLGSLLADAAVVVGQLLVMLCLLFFLLRDGPAYVRRIRALLPLPADEADRLLTSTHDLVVASVGAGLLVALIQGALGGLAFWGLGLPAPVVWGAAMALCALVPVVGSALVWGPAALWLLATGDGGRAAVLLVLGVGVIGMVDNVLRPLLLSERTAAGGLVVFIGLLGGAAAFGFVGIVLGPIVLVTAASLLDSFTNRVHAHPHTLEARADDAGAPGAGPSA